MTQTCLVNLFHLDPERNGGLSRVAREISQMLAGYGRANPLRVIFAVGWRFAGAFPAWLEDEAVEVIPCLPEKDLSPLFKALQPDLLVSPLLGLELFDGYDNGRKPPHVVLMPDTLLFEAPGLSPVAKTRQQEQLRASLCNAARVVTLSEYSRQGLSHYTGLSLQQITVIPLAGDGLGETGPLSAVAQPYLFYPANGWPSKRHSLLIQIMAELWSVRPELKLVLTGWQEAGFIAGLAQRYGCPASQIIDLGYVADQQLAGLYRQAEALLFTSEYEGFGMPLLEAMANGCPVICAPLTAIPEVAGEAALYVDSTNPADWAETLLRELPERRADLIEKGLARARLFSWKQMRQQWLQVLVETGLTPDPSPVVRTPIGKFHPELGEKNGDEISLPLSVVTKELAIWSSSYATGQAELKAKEAEIQTLAGAAQARADELVAKEAMIKALQHEVMTAKDEIIQLLRSEAATVNGEVQMLRNELAGAEAMLQGLQAEVTTIKEGIIQDQRSQLAAQEKVIQLLQEKFELSRNKLTPDDEVQMLRNQLVAKEEVIQKLEAFRLASLRSGRLTRLFHSGFIWLGHLAWDQFSPRLGVLRHYPPIPWKTPPWYTARPAPANPPLISIVTPTFNHAAFLERTINSILAQNYPTLEYIIQDGGSTDGAVAILEKYRASLKHAESRPDKGQAHALNLGFAHAAGEIMAYLNSDDLLLPGALSYVAAFFAKHPEVDVIYGHRVLINENDQEIGRWVLPPHDRKVLFWADYVPQETLFWRRRIWEKTGGYIDESYCFALDWELLLRFEEVGAKFARLPRFLGAFRVHLAQKSSDQIDDVGQQEMSRLRERYHGRSVSQQEIRQAIGSYLARSVIYHKLYRLGLLRY